MFLGPSAENLELFQKLVDDIILDAAFLRRNYQPNDDPIVTEYDKTKTDYIQASADVRNHLKSVLSGLKQSVPTYHPRHIGHMNADVFMSGIVGFFGAMMYNPNNIINVASPTTTEMEIEYINQLCKMVGFNEISTQSAEHKPHAWGHICSGGTLANIEALWVLRNLKYYPITLKLVSCNKDTSFIGQLTIPSLHGKRISECNYAELFNMSVDDIYDLMSNLSEAIANRENKDLDNDTLRLKVANFYDNNIKDYTVQKVGVAGIHQMVVEQGCHLDLPIVYVSHTHHYSWEKAMDIIGLGVQQLHFIKTNNNFQLDIETLEKELRKGKPVLAVVNIMGTTEEGAFDPLSKILDLKAKNNNAFFVHVDGAYGGYFASFPSDENTEIKDYINKVYNEEIGVDKFATSLSSILSEHFSFDSEWKQNINALCHVDSITIDPHKLGYIPYPAGAILFKDYRSRQTISFEAPYVSNDESAKSTEIFLGKWTMEGSRPGAAAVACCLSGRVLPLDADNHGKLLACTVISAARLFQAINNFNANREDGFQIKPLFKTDSNCVCYIVTNPRFVNSPVLLNYFTKAVVDELTINPKTKIIPDYDFIISQSEWSYEDYEEYINNIMKGAGIDESRFNEMKGRGLQYIRSVMMNPLAAYESNSFFDDYFTLIGQIANKALVKAFAQLIYERNKHQWLRIAWIENDDKMQTQAEHIQNDPNYGHALHIDFYDYNNGRYDVKKLDWLNMYDAIIVDLNLEDANHHLYKTQNGMNLIKDIRKTDKDKTILVCSEYLSDKNPNYNIVKYDLIDPEEELGLTEEMLVPKCRLDDNRIDYEGNKLRLIHAIFNMLQQKG